VGHYRLQASAVTQVQVPIIRASDDQLVGRTACCRRCLREVPSAGGITAALPYGCIKGAISMALGTFKVQVLALCMQRRQCPR
jgi:hypothetical protein